MLVQLGLYILPRSSRRQCASEPGALVEQLTGSLECAGFATLRCSVTHSATAVLDALATFTVNQHTLGFPCDGLVVSLDSKLRQRDLGATSRAPRWSISLKP